MDLSQTHSLDLFHPLEKDNDLSAFIQPKPRRKDRNLFNFSHNYFKLQAREFTTIRSVNYAKKHDIQIGDEGWITLSRQRHKTVRVVRWEDKAIKDIPLKVLQLDMNYPSHYILDPQDFVDGLNDFQETQYHIRSHSLKTIKRIFYLEEIFPPHFHRRTP